MKILFRNYLLISSLLVSLCSCIPSGFTRVLFTTSKIEVLGENTGEYKFSGPIGIGTSEVFRKQLPQGAHIYLDSPGGLTTESTQIASFMQDKDIALTITGWCASSCANYLSVNPTLVLEKDALLAFHGAGFGIHEDKLEDCGGVKTCSLEEIGELATQSSAIEMQFVRENDLSIDFLIFSAEVVTSTGRLWIPTIKELNCYGLNIVDSPSDYPNLERLRSEKIEEYAMTSNLSQELQDKITRICSNSS